jgi:hypothetical protein
MEDQRPRFTVLLFCRKFKCIYPSPRTMFIHPFGRYKSYLIVSGFIRWKSFRLAADSISFGIAFRLKIVTVRAKGSYVCRFYFPPDSRMPNLLCTERVKILYFFFVSFEFLYFLFFLGYTYCQSSKQIV